MRPLKPDDKPSATGLPIQMMVLVLLVGLAGRAWLADLGTRWGYLGDHLANVCWGATAWDVGLLNIYKVEREQIRALPTADCRGGAPLRVEPARTGLLPNHPPLTMTLVYALQAKWLSWVDPSMTVNTFASRSVMAIVPTIFDALTALGAMLLAWQLFGRKAGLLAGAATWLCPPLAMNTAFWGQVDSLLLAPMLFMLLLMIRRRWLLAGACVGVSLLLKPQGLLLAPVAMFAAVAISKADPEAKVGLLEILRRLGVFAAAAIVAAGVLSLPWTIAGGIEWARVCYVDNLFKAYPQTTLKAFNIWYLDLLRLDTRLVCAEDSRATILGLSKDLWGRLLLLAALAATAILCWRKYRRAGLGVVVFAGLWLWSTFILPTRSHERYIIYAVVPMVVLAAGLRKYWPALLGLVIVASAEHCWDAWMDPGTSAGDFMQIGVAENIHRRWVEEFREVTANIPPEQRQPEPTLEEATEVYRSKVRDRFPDYRIQRRANEPWEYGLTILSLLSYGWAMVLGLRPDKRAGPVSAGPRPAKAG